MKTTLVIFLLSAITASALQGIEIVIKESDFDAISTKMSTVMDDIVSHSAQPMTFSWDRKYWELSIDPIIGDCYKGKLSNKQMGDYVDRAKLNTYRNDLKPFKVGRDFNINVTETQTQIIKGAGQ